MGDLVSIAPATKAVALGSAAVVVTGLSLRKLTQLIVAYPDLVGLVTGSRIEIAALLEQAPDGALAIFSLGVVGRARPKWWRAATAMMSDTEDDLVAAFDAAPSGQQIEILGTIFDLTFRGSERAIPFLKTLLVPAPAPESPVPPQPPTPETPVSSMPDSLSG